MSYFEEQMTWCKKHKHEVDQTLVDLCPIVKSKKGCANCEHSGTLKISSNMAWVKFEGSEDVLKVVLTLHNQPLPEAILT